MSPKSISETSLVFAPFFELQKPGLLLHGATLLGAECVFKNYPAGHPRQRPSLFGAGSYPMGVAKKVLDMGDLRVAGSNLQEQIWRGRKTGQPIRLILEAGSETRLIAFYTKGRENIGVEFNFDVVNEDKTVDTLDIYSLGNNAAPQRKFSFESETSCYPHTGFHIPSSQPNFGASLAESGAFPVAQRWFWMIRNSLWLARPRPTPREFMSVVE